MRLVWKLKPPSPQGPDPQTLLAQLKARFRFSLPPQPVWEGADFFQAVPATQKIAKQVLEFLQDHQDVVEHPTLEGAVQPPDSAVPVDRGPQPTLVWEPVKLKGRRARSHDWQPYQIYLRDAASGGIDALHAWRFRGGRGGGVRVVDVEIGCDTQHEDLKRPLARLDVPDDSHGTEALGVCCADPDNRVGVVGIAHRARTTLAPVERKRVGLKFFLNVAEVLRRVVRNLQAGDVILLELEGHFEALSAPHVRRFTESLPIETAPDVRALIDEAGAKGIYVIEPAGNGSQDLDLFGFDPGDRSAAILVGAGHPLTREHLGISNFGSRVDVQGWGMAVVTASRVGTLQDHPDPSKRYGQHFNATSSAAAIVAGAVACLSGIAKANDFGPLSPLEMRDLLVGTGSLQGGDLSKNIGPLPNLRTAIDELERRVGHELRRAA